MAALLRAVRRQRGLTLERLAEQTGLTKSYLSKIERGHSTPSIAVALKVARALDVDVGRLFSEAASVEKIAVDRALDGDQDRPGARQVRYRALAPSLLGKSMSPFVVRPSGALFDLPHAEHTGQEFVFVHAGTVELDYGDRTITLDTGDSAYFDASVSHQLRTVGTAPAEVVVVTHNDPR
ncbi:helix-turn-helix domain-containing protein [Mycobacterium asiaticum]|uniref:DNA-binding protein n=1 Tax=Mycobacterium asiaticum TaxID=1790 RepID=A0A1A3HR71_MYCAS|nr:XRE family transcriptional regulator [Mycobacterium asiaticum]OBI93188.1 DNA-binding protein [Mycobacterium asiaticum]OBJ50159.1 DNA-binding protein [Mycobacterium asiaticum]OBJ84711.1 DNA-binding protein [Mycobacterium asiaticum]ORA09396.1 DNA-binding protein [Mycobacterium asiaticum DSM 44297]